MPLQLPSTKYIQPPQVQVPPSLLVNKKASPFSPVMTPPKQSLHRVAYKIYNDTNTSTVFITPTIKYHVSDMPIKEQLSK